MIAHLRGRLLEIRPPVLVLDVQGVGYELEAPMTTFYDLPDAGADVVLHTHMVVREDAQLLYGFADAQQRDLFRSLLRVNGIGPRVGLAVLSSLSTVEFFRCVSNDDLTQLTKVPGIGRKTAQRLLVEMRDRIALVATVPDNRIDEQPAATSSPLHDAVSALISLGYKPVEANRAVRQIHNGDLSSEDLIRQALRVLAGGTA